VAARVEEEGLGWAQGGRRLRQWLGREMDEYGLKALCQPGLLLVASTGRVAGTGKMEDKDVVAAAQPLARVNKFVRS